ncbi:MAG: DUF5106 domain-containing protein [Bacteroidales bacterium]|nr:DUF5106 domain-containing protein [Bacteroidales bacterium]
MKRIILLLLVSAILTEFAAAQGYEIKVKIHHIPNDTVILGHHFNERLLPDDTVVLDNKCEGVFRGKEKLPVGMYFIFLPSRNYFDILIDGSQTFSIENDTTPSEFLKNMKITGSIENQIFHDYQVVLREATLEYNELTAQFEKIKGDSVKENEIKEKKKAIEQRIEQEYINQKTQYPDQFFSKFLTATRDVKVPESITAKTDRFYYYKAHYFDNFPLEYAPLLRTTIYQPKIEKYITNLCMQMPDSLIKECKMLVGKVRGNEELFRFMLVSLYNKYHKNEEMHDVYIELAKIFCEEAVWATDSFKNELRKEISKDVELSSKDVELSIKEERERKLNEILNKYKANYASVAEEVAEYEKYVNEVSKAYHSHIGWDGRSKVIVTQSNVAYQLNKAIAIAEKTIDPQLIKRLYRSYNKFYYLQEGKRYDGFFSKDFWEKVYPKVAKNHESLDFEIYYFKTIYPSFEYYSTEYKDNVISRISNEIPKTPYRDRQAQLYNDYVEIYRIGNKQKNEINTSLSDPICKSYVDEILSTRSATVIEQCDKITKKWPNYQNDIYIPTEEVRLYNKLKNLAAKDSRDLFSTIDLYLQKYANSGNDISGSILSNLQSMKDQESADAIINMIHNYSAFINQHDNYNTKLNDLLYKRLTNLDASSSIRTADKLVEDNASYMQSNPTFDTQVQTVYLTKLSELDESNRNEQILEAISRNKRYSSKMKQKFNPIVTIYTWIKNNSSASYKWTGIIDQYLSCFPTNVHKTELTNLRNKYSEEIRRREEERRRAEEERRAREASVAAQANNPRVGDYVQVETRFSCGLLCSTPNFIITGYVTRFSKYGYSNELTSLSIEVKSISGKRGEDYTDDSWKIAREKAEIGSELHFSNSGEGSDEFHNLIILNR